MIIAILNELELLKMSLQEVNNSKSAPIETHQQSAGASFIVTFQEAIQGLPRIPNKMSLADFDDRFSSVQTGTLSATLKVLRQNSHDAKKAIRTGDGADKLRTNSRHLIEMRYWQSIVSELIRSDIETSMEKDHETLSTIIQLNQTFRGVYDALINKPKDLLSSLKGSSIEEMENFCFDLIRTMHQRYNYEGTNTDTKWERDIVFELVRFDTNPCAMIWHICNAMGIDHRSLNAQPTQRKSPFSLSLILLKALD